MRSDEELREMGIEEANTKLSDSDFSRWKDLREDSLYREAEENIEEMQERDESAIDTLISSAEDSLSTSIELFGNKYEFLVSLNREQRNVFKEIKQKRDEASEEDIDLEEIDGISSLVKEFLASVSKDFGESDWDRFEGEYGFVGVYDIFVKVMRVFQEEMGEKREEIKNFRSE